VRAFITFCGLVYATTIFAATGPEVAQSFGGKLPLQFERNQGQTDPAVSFFARTGGGAMFFTADGIAMTRHGRAVRLRFVAPNPGVQLQPGEETIAKTNYFVGNDPQKWRRDVSTFSGVTYRNLFDDVDLALVGEDKKLKGTYTIAPGSDAHSIAWKYDGARSTKIDKHGNLRVKLRGGDELMEEAPVAWQEDASGRQPVNARYVIRNDGAIGFSLGAYDHSKRLTIDPTLTYSTFFGASNDDPAYKIALDCERNIYIAGYTNSLDFPTKNPIQSNKADGYDNFITKLTPDGSTVLWSTYLGGSGPNNGNDLLQSMTVDLDGNVYLTGNTYSTDYPTVNAYQATNHGGSEVFLTKIDNSGSTLIYSTYLGGGNFEYAFDIAVDANGCAYVTGNTISSDFPTTPGVYQSTFGGGGGDVYVTKLSADGKSLIYSTYIGGSDIDEARAIAVDANNNVIVGGVTASLNYPLANAYQGIIGGGRDVLVAKLNSTGSQLIFSTYLGGALDEQASAMTIDRAGNVYLTGRTMSANFPTAPLGGVFQPAIGSVTDAFVSKLSANGSTLMYSTFLGGVQTDYGYGIAVNDAGEAYAVGQTASLNFPQANAVQAYGGGSDAYVTKFNATGTATIYSTYVGGGSDEGALSVVRDGLGAIFVTGFTRSTNFPTANALQPTYAGGSSDAFISKIAEAAAPSLSITSATRLPNGRFSLTGRTTPNIPLTIQVAPNLPAPFTAIAALNAGVDGTFAFEDANAASLQQRFYRAAFPCPTKY
jgi:hypothetical protein